MSSATVDDLEAALAAHADAEAQSDSDDEDDEPTASTSKAVVEEKLKPGMARIVRDENGNVVSIIVGGQNGEEVEEKIVEPSRAAGGEDGEGSDDNDESDDEEEKEEPSPWGAPMKDWSVKNADEVPQFDDSEDLVMADAATAVRKPAKVKQGIEISGPVKRVAAKSEVIRGTSLPSPLPLYSTTVLTDISRPQFSSDKHNSRPRSSVLRRRLSGIGSSRSWRSTTTTLPRWRGIVRRMCGSGRRES